MLWINAVLSTTPLQLDVSSSMQNTTYQICNIQLEKRSWEWTIEVRNMSSYWMLRINLIVKHCVSCWITCILLLELLTSSRRRQKSILKYQPPFINLRCVILQKFVNLQFLIKKTLYVPPLGYCQPYLIYVDKTHCMYVKMGDRNTCTHYKTLTMWHNHMFY